MPILFTIPKVTLFPNVLIYLRSTCGLLLRFTQVLTIFWDNRFIRQMGRAFHKWNTIMMKTLSLAVKPLLGAGVLSDISEREVHVLSDTWISRHLGLLKLRSSNLNCVYEPTRFKISHDPKWARTETCY